MQLKKKPNAAQILIKNFFFSVVITLQETNFLGALWNKYQPQNSSTHTDQDKNSKVSTVQGSEESYPKFKSIILL